MKWKLVLSYGDVLGMYRRQQGVYDYHSRLLGLLLAGSGSLIVHGELKTMSSLPDGLWCYVFTSALLNALARTHENLIYTAILFWLRGLHCQRLNSKLFAETVQVAEELLRKTGVPIC